MKSWFTHSIKGYRPLWRAHGVLLPFPCVNNSRTLIFKIHRPSSFSIFFIFLTFSSNKHWWWLHVFSFNGRRTIKSRVAPPSEGRLQHCTSKQTREREREISLMLSYIFTPKQTHFWSQIFKKNNPYNHNIQFISMTNLIPKTFLKLILFINFTWKLLFMWNLRLTLSFDSEGTHF